MSGVFRTNELLTPPSPPSECVLPRTKGLGVYTFAGRWGGVGCGVNISEDARHCIGLLRYNPSTLSPLAIVLSARLRGNSIMGYMNIAFLYMYRITVHAHHKINKKYNSNQLSSWTIWLLFLLLFKSNIFFVAFQFIALPFKTIEQHSYQVIFTFLP